MVKKSKILFLWFAMLILVIPEFTFAASSASRRVDYLPRDQELVEVLKPDGTATYPYNIPESTCVAVEVNQTKWARCNECLTLKNGCPDCCLSGLGTASRAIRCNALSVPAKPFVPNPAAPGNRGKCVLVDVPLPNYTSPGSDSDADYTRFQTYCGDARLPNIQKLGCPSDEPANDGTTVKCTGLGSGHWVCNSGEIDDRTNDALEYSGCVPNSSSTVTDCTTLMHTSGGGKAKGKKGGTSEEKGFYNVELLDPADCAADYPTYSNGSGECWEYEMYDEIRTCISSCVSDANAYEQANKTSDCCNRDSNVCANGIHGVNGEGRPGFNNNCQEESCQRRIDWAECGAVSGGPGDDACCDGLTDDDCARIATELNADIDDVANGGVDSCFNDISKSGDPFKYDFVAKSNEKLLVIWQVGATPQFCSNALNCAVAANWGVGAEPDTYFYTRIEILDETDGGRAVYPGIQGSTIMNQRSFTSAFSIYAAAVAVNPDGTSIFQQGRKYSIRLYYLLAPLNNYTLRSSINRLQLQVLRIRE